MELSLILDFLARTGLKWRALLGLLPDGLVHFRRFQRKAEVSQTQEEPSGPHPFQEATRVVGKASGNGEHHIPKAPSI